MLEIVITVATFEIVVAIATLKIVVAIAALEIVVAVAALKIVVQDFFAEFGRWFLAARGRRRGLT